MPGIYEHPNIKHHREPDRRGDEIERVDQFWDLEISRRKGRTKSWVALTVGVVGIISTLFLLATSSSAVFGDMYLMAIVAAAFAGGSSAWLSASGAKGLWNTRPLSPPARRFAGSRGKGDSRPEERQLLEVIERYGEVTPTKAALETYLTVDEAEAKLSELAERGHLDVRAEGGKLVYAL